MVDVRFPWLWFKMAIDNLSAVGSPGCQEADGQRLGAMVKIAHSQPPVSPRESPDLRSGLEPKRAGLGRAIAMPLLLAFAVAFLIHAIQSSAPGQWERNVMRIGVVLAVATLGPLAVVVWVRRQRFEPGRFGLMLITGMATLLMGVYFYSASFYVTFPGNFLLWSESDFVKDILKFSLGHPLFAAPEDHESLFYNPGSQLVTYLLASILGYSNSIPVYRGVQVFFTMLAALLATLCCRRIVGRKGSDLAWWTAFWYPALFLVATNLVTNRYTQFLHNDALAQLMTLASFWLLLVYLEGRDLRVLAAMALMPSLGFLVKQSLVIWALFYCIGLAFSDRPRSWRRLLLFAGGTIGMAALTVAACRMVFGPHYFYWTFSVLGGHAVSPLRSFQHLIDAWAFVAAGLAGGLLLLRGPAYRALLGPWLVSIAVLLSEIYTSGIAWMLNHVGPGSLLAATWFFAGVSRIWPRSRPSPLRDIPSRRWMVCGLATAMLSIALLGFQVMRVPAPVYSESAYQYAKAIEREFDGFPAERVLLDHGSWVHTQQKIVMKDGMAAIGEQAYSMRSDFSGILRRLRERHYQKILVRNLHRSDFWYDGAVLPKSTGIRQAILDNYRVTGRIPAAVHPLPVEFRTDTPYMFDEITILQPKLEGVH